MPLVPIISVLKCNSAAHTDERTLRLQRALNRIVAPSRRRAPETGRGRYRSSAPVGSSTPGDVPS